MTKIKFNSRSSNFLSILVLLLCIGLLYLSIITHDYFTIFILISFGILFIFCILGSGNNVKDLSIDEKHIKFNFINSLKNRTKIINLEDIEIFHIDVDTQRNFRSVGFYINFAIKIKNIDEKLNFSSFENGTPNGLRSFFDIQEMIPNFTYNITSNDESSRKCWLYYAENKKFSETDIKYSNALKKSMIILIIVFLLPIIISIIIRIILDFINV